MNPQEDNTLEEMRRQMAILQEKLDNETIVNERLLRESMKHNYSSINRYLSVEATILMPIIIIAFPALALIFHLSWGPVIAVILLCLADVIFDYKVNHIKDEAFMGDNLIPTALRLQRAKRLTVLQMMVSLPLMILWFAWFIIDFFQSIDYQDELLTASAYGGIVGGCIGLVCGIIFAIQLYRKQQKTRQQVIDQINDLTAGNTPES
jgi:glucan phosphoethanolaminetransferase (alkaline phosphatase superfamily)